MGFLTYLYRSATTNFFGGSHGARVPLPTFKNDLLVYTTNPNPKRIKNIPTANINPEITELEVNK